MFMSLIHFELIFCVWDKDSISFFCMWVSSFASTICWHQVFLEHLWKKLNKIQTNGRHLVFMGLELNTAKMSIFLKGIYRFNSILIKIPVESFYKSTKTSLKFMWNHKRWLAKLTLRKRDKARDIPCPCSKIYHKVTIIIIVCTGIKTDIQWNIEKLPVAIMSIQLSGTNNEVLKLLFGVEFCCQCWGQGNRMEACFINYFSTEWGLCKVQSMWHTWYYVYESKTDSSHWRLGLGWW
jgi:hypothetical protein